MSAATSTLSSPAHPGMTTPASAAVIGIGRKPSRKNTLTQQQKNQKRQRATQDQLVTLEAEFNKNPTPTAVVRERIAQQINMTERSVQIWFQNRRAKIKLMAKKSIENGEECDVPESMRLYLAQQAAESGKGIPRHLFEGRMGYGNALAADPSPQRKLVIHHFNCRSLTIGSWRRIGQTTMDLVIFYCPDRACITYYINNDSAGYKIEYPFSFIKSIELETVDSPANTLNKQGHIVVTLTRPPLFFMDSSGSGGFYQCMDFTEKQQASEVLVHYLGGHPKTLAQQLAKLTTLDAFMNRHAPQVPPPPPSGSYDHPQFSISSPQSPGIVRPASSNDVAPSQNYHIDVRHSHSFQKHKRQRSRSVPTAVDFSALGPIPNFSFQETHDQLFAPAPQHTPNRLTIDTTQSGFLDYRATSYPLSAATTTSPSDYSSPNFMSNTLQGDVNPNAGYGSPYSVPFLSPSVDAQTMLGSSVSPLLMGNGEPVIADSPQLEMMGATAMDLYSIVPDETLFADEGMSLSDLYSKQLTTGSPEFVDADDMQSQLMQFPLS